MASKIDIVIQAVDNLSATMQKIEGNVKRVTTQIGTSMKSVQTSAQQTSVATVASVDKMNTAFGTLSTNVRRIGALVGSFYAVKSAIQALGGLADDFKDLNANMAYVNTIAQLTDERLAALTVTVRDLSVELGKPAPELALGLYDIYSSGFKGAEAMKILEVSTKGSIAGLTDVATASRGLMAVMNAYNMKTGPDAVKIMDLLFKTVDKGVITFSEIAAQIGSVVTVASQLGVPFEDVSAAMAQMSLRGIDAAEGATALEGLMRSIMKPASQAKETIAKLNENQKGLNLQWDVAALRAKGLAGMIQSLNKAAQGNFEVIGRVIPEIRGMRAEMVLGSEDTKGFVEMQGYMADSVGATDKAFVEAKKSIKQQLIDMTAELKAYESKLGEVIAGVELKLMTSAVSFAKWADENQKSIISVLTTIKDLTLAFFAYKAIVLTISGISSIIAWFNELCTAAIATKIAMTGNTAAAVAFRTATTSLINPITLLVAELALIVSMAIQGAAALKQEKAQMEAFRKENDILQASVQKNLKIMNNNAQSSSAVSALFNTSSTSLNAELNKGKENLFTFGKSMTASFNAGVSSEPMTMAELLKKQQETAQTLLGLPNPSAPKTTGAKTKNDGSYTPTKDLLGPDDALSKIADKIKTVSKDISDFYGKIGDFSNDFKKELEDQANSLNDLGLKFGRYLADTNTDLTRLEDKHKETITSITDDVAQENKKFNDSMDERARKFNDTMSEMSTSHSDKTADLQHDIDLEVGMGLRADKEKLADLRLRLARENRDYADNVADNVTQNNIDIASSKEDNAIKLADLQERLAQEKEDYQQKVDDIQTQMDREKADYASQQNDILSKTQETLQGVVASYQKAFKSVYDTIIASGVPALLSKLPELTKVSIENSLSGVSIPRNIMAEQEFVKNWGGKYGRLPNQQEISMGVYGTASGPNTAAGVNVTINNPIVSNQDMINSLIKQATEAIAQAQNLAKSGAY